MHLDQLQAFVVAAREGSISRAAEQLFVSQPSVSRRLQALERELGCKLVRRRGQGIVLTEKGQELLPFAQDIVARAEQAVRLVAAHPRRSAATLAIGATPTLASYVLPQLLSRFQREVPNAPRVTVRTGVSAALLPALLEGRLDMLLCRSRVGEAAEITVRRLFREPLWLVASPDHPLARGGNAHSAGAQPGDTLNSRAQAGDASALHAEARTAAGVSPGDLPAPPPQGSWPLPELSRWPLICSAFQSPYWEATERFLAALGVSVQVAMDIDHCDTVKQVLPGSPYLAFLPRSTVQREVAAGHLAALPWPAPEPPFCAAYLVRRREARSSPAVRAFEDFLAFVDVPTLVS